ncbi:cell division septation protein DedD [Deinococcus metalli]|uniref:Cell division septation protein DedD n=1 Tax=Deinococcus metalli TaxID=1141878 RepID=A0A7W8NPB3_9DEIO|nr:SPOR domain-containing protein [Deinococcus metalli]MBB5375575.1 cell division septation protein DedD [Deinococcus metalli]GHF28247.1 hypothetical protein GCM10017781_00200 [Deinococcus metalli]
MSRPATRPRRWPDLLIGVLVVLLLVGFGLLLFRPETRTAMTPAATPATPAASTETTSIPSAPTPAETTAQTPAPAPAQSGTATTSEPPTIAAAPVEATPPVSATPAQGTATTTPTEQPDQPATTPTTATPRSGGAVATSEQRVPLRSDYRITLGTFSTSQAATTAAASVSALGYTVYPIDLGSQVVAQVGPFADETSARQALADIQRAYPGALLYPPRGRSLGQNNAGGGASTAANPSASAAETTATPAPAPAPSGPTYLQVGAFDRVESAQKLVQQLRDLGYAPTVNAPEGKKVTVLVGPYTGDAVTRTEQRLSGSGIDHFRVR